jgi:hypothetical protein
MTVLSFDSRDRVPMRPLLAAATHAVDLAAPVPVHEVGEPVSRRRLLSHASWWPLGSDIMGGRPAESGREGCVQLEPADLAEETPVLP